MKSSHRAALPRSAEQVMMPKAANEQNRTEQVLEATFGTQAPH